MKIYKLMIMNDEGEVVSETYHETAEKAEEHKKELELHSGSFIRLENFEIKMIEVN